MPPRAVNDLNATDAAYLAGLIDGEGTITLSRKHAGDRRQLVVSVVSTEPEIPEWVLRAVGVGKITRKRIASDRHAPSRTYSVSNRQALRVLARVRPFLRSYKRERADLALTSYVALTTRTGKRRDATRTATAVTESAALLYSRRA